MKDYYNILGLQPNASEDEIRQAYKRLAMKHHPDRGGNETQFQEIQEAHSVLTDPQKKQQWEHERHFQQHGHPGNSGFSFNFGPDLNDIINQFHGGVFFGQGFQRQVKNRDLRTLIEVDLESTLNQQTKFVEIRDQSGAVRTVQVNIPKGVQTGMQMRFGGHGDNSNRSVPPGDLFVEFVIKPHPIFKIDGLNIIKTEIVNAIDAIIGINLTINGLDGKTFDVKVPSGTQPGTVIRLSQQGLYDINTPRRGDLLLEIKIDIPKTITQIQIEMLQRLN